MHVSMVELDIAAKKMFFCSLHGGLSSNSRHGLQEFVFFYLHPSFLIWLISNFRRVYKIKIILSKEKGRA